MSYDEEKYIEENSTLSHYHGNIVRKLLLINGLGMVAEYAFFSTLVRVPFFIAIGGAIVLVILAGLQNPKLRWLNEINALVAIVACFTFAYIGTSHYLYATIFDPFFFWSNQVHALLFLIAVYYSSKTVRAMFISLPKT